MDTMHLLVIFFVCILLTTGFWLESTASMKRYDHHSLIRLHSMNHSSSIDQSLLSLLRRHPDLYRWSASDFLIPPSQLKSVEHLLNEHRVPFSIIQNNVQTLVDAEQKRLSQRKIFSASKENDNGSDNFFSEYHRYDEIVAFFANLTVHYPSFIRAQSLGKTYLGKEQFVYIITSNKSDGSMNNKSISKPAIILLSGISPRAWIAPATVTYMATQLVEQYAHDVSVTELMDSFVWIIIPVVNIDGYDYTWTNDRFWTKTQTPNKGSNCIGSNVGFNWNDHFMVDQYTNDTCSDLYCGPSAASEPCVANVQSFILSWQNDSSKGKIIASFEYSSYYQYWLTPFAWNQDPPKEIDNITAASNEAVAAIAVTTNMDYTVDAASRMFAPSSFGTFIDYVYDVAGIIYSFSVELRDLGQYAYTLPPDQIIPSGQEIFAGTKATVQYIQKHLYDVMNENKQLAII